MQIYFLIMRNPEDQKTSATINNNNNKNSLFNLGFTMLSHRIKLELFRQIQ